MDLVHLRYFRAIVETGSMTAAAKTLGVGQPALTQAVKKLEEHLESTLLLRNPRGVTVTPSGAVLAEAAAQILSLVDETEQRVLGVERDDRGKFVIGCHESLGAYFLPAFMRAFFGHHGNIDIGVWNGTSADVREAVLRRQVHFGFSVNPRPHDELVMVDAFQDAVAIVARRDIVDAITSESAAQNVLKAGPLIFADRVDQCRQIVDNLAGRSLLPDRLISTGDLELTKSLVVAGVGVGILPRRVANYGHEGELVVLHPSLPEVPDRIVLCWRADAHKTVAWTHTKTALLNHAAGMLPIPGRRD